MATGGLWRKRNEKIHIGTCVYVSKISIINMHSKVKRRENPNSIDIFTYSLFSKYTFIMILHT